MTRPRSPLCWVLGAGGLLGSQLVAALRQAGGPRATLWPCVVPHFSWLDRPALREELERAVTAFARAVPAHEGYAILWAAGSGSIAATPESLAADTELWELFLSLLARHLPRAAGPGVLLWPSSAGAVYGASLDDPITESSRCLPISEYGEAKLVQEGLASDFAAARSDVSVITTRVTTLYGPGQNLRKPQGLIAHLSRGLIYQRPVHLYVPLDNLRDYLYVTDCAERLWQCLGQVQRLAAESGRAQRILKLIVSEQVTSIAYVLRLFKQIARRAPPIVCAQSPLTQRHPPRMAFRSQILRDPRPPKTALLEGISRTHQHQLLLFQQGLLPS